MLPQFISSHNNESVKFVVRRLFERTEMWYEKFNYTQIYIISADDPGLSNCPSDSNSTNTTGMAVTPSPVKSSLKDGEQELNY